MRVKNLKPGQVNEIIDELKIMLGVASDSELADALGIGKSNFVNWRKRGNVPHFVMQIYHGRLIVSRGEKNSQRVEEPEESGQYHLKTQAAMAHASLDAILEHMTDAERQAIFASTMELKWKYEMEQHIAELSGEIAALRQALKQ